MEKMVRVQVSITDEELEVLKEWIPLSDAMYEDALINGIVKQIKEKTDEPNKHNAKKNTKDN